MNNEHLNHSCSHLLAAAVLELWPHALPTLGPPIENGFYYDFDFGDTKISDTDLAQIEAKMHQISPFWKNFEEVIVTPGQAKKDFQNNPYKLELINELTDQKITYYKSGDFFDLCRGGHADLTTQPLNHFKLLSVAGAYWRGSEKNKMLTRIYGTCWPSQKELDDYLNHLEEVKKRDHRKLGKLLDLWTFSDLVGSGLPLYTPKGAFLRKTLNDYVESVQSGQKYYQVWTNQFARAQLFKTSGHYDKYKDSMFRVASNFTDEEFFLKPMNCPQHTQIYASQPKSYRDLPIRYTDFAMLYRDEKPGELTGLSRVRSFSQDDCHVFCTEDQVDTEVDMMLAMTKSIMNTFGFKYKYRLSTRDPLHPEKYLGDPLTWDKVEKWAVKIMDRNHIDYIDGPGEAAFYAPKMDLIATDALGREWQLSTVQIDYVMPQRFSLEYTDRDGLTKTPIMLHRAIIGSAERFIAIILEHFAGNLPTWLNPVQVKVLPISDRHLEYSRQVHQKLLDNQIRSELDDRNDTLKGKIRDAQLQKASYMLVLGDKEVQSQTVTERARSGKADGPFPIETFITNIKSEIKEKVNT